ncbi:hypothetical protein PIROE2DRAFT_66834 [Piromyces sp. E2]|nr:hypothetical protein PIROE2DRAFT_66834 [Piromyces sp. E2]|eukprot:OUM69279.1 hypothetical protein PIROE2DRAFT_66834 [Piromyces sp. E2]
MRQLFRMSIKKANTLTYNDKNLLPLYLISNYNIYGTDQPYFPDYVAGYGIVRSLDAPILNSNRTINYYGFDITSPIVSDKTVIYDISYEKFTNNTSEFMEEIQSSKKLFFSLKNNKKRIRVKNEDHYNLEEALTSIYEEKSIFEM